MALIENWSILHSRHAKDQAHRTEVEDIAVLQELGFQGDQCKFAETGFVAALEVFDIEEGFLKADTGVLARNGHARVDARQVDFGTDIALGVYPAHDNVVATDGKMLGFSTLGLIYEIRQNVFLYPIACCSKYGGILPVDDCSLQ